MTDGSVWRGGEQAEGLRSERALTKECVREFLTRLLLTIGKVPADRICDTSSLDADLQMESVAFIEIQVALEEEFEIEIDLLQVVEINELAGIVEYIHDLARDAFLRASSPSSSHSI